MEKKIEKGTQFIPQEMIDYSEGGIVSKEFLHNDAGSLTLFAFDAGQALSEHSATIRCNRTSARWRGSY